MESDFQVLVNKYNLSFSFFNFSLYHDLIDDIVSYLDTQIINDELIKTSGLYCNFIGTYYMSELKDLKKSKYYYLKSIELGTKAYYNLGLLYFMKNNYKKMKINYLCAIENKCVQSMINLADYYKTKKKYDKMEKYYLMAIELNNVISMYNLGIFYDLQGNKKKMKLYLNMAIKLNDIQSIIYMAFYYAETKPKKTKKYFLMGIELKDSNSMSNMGAHYIGKNKPKKMIKYFNMAIEYKNTTAMINMALYYKNKSEFKKMKYYFYMAAELKDILAYIELAMYYYKKNKFTKTDNYCSLAIDINYIKALYDIIILYMNDIKNYDKMKYYIDLLIEKNNNSYIFDECLQNVISYCKENKILLTYAYQLCIKFKHDDPELAKQAHIIMQSETAPFDECSICYEEHRLVDFDCGKHKFCISCTDKINLCAYCRVAKK